jgi:serine/threonine protein kinase
MHRAHVIHRDIKLQNFMLDENNDIIIIGKDKSLIFKLKKKRIYVE